MKQYTLFRFENQVRERAQISLFRKLFKKREPRIDGALFPGRAGSGFFDDFGGSGVAFDALDPLDAGGLGFVAF